MCGRSETCPATIQALELLAFVAAKDKNIERMMTEPDDDAGTVWAHVAMCADTKLIFRTS